MHISWLGGTAFKLQIKHLNHDVTALIDPVKPKQGSAPRSLTADIVVSTKADQELITVSGSPFILSGPGECETKGVLMSAMANGPGETVVRLDAEQMSLGHLGRISAMPNKACIDLLSGVDVLFVPVDSKSALSPETALKLVNTIEPRVVIPMAFQSDNDPKADPPAAFFKELGSNPQPESKIILKKKDLPEEDTAVYHLSKE